MILYRLFKFVVFIGVCFAYAECIMWLTRLLVIFSGHYQPSPDFLTILAPRLANAGAGAGLFVGFFFGPFENREEDAE